MSELKRWAADGRLPVMFRRRIPTSVGVTMLVRYWDVASVEQSAQHLTQWRLDDLHLRRAKRATR